MLFTLQPVIILREGRGRERRREGERGRERGDSTRTRFSHKNPVSAARKLWPHYLQSKKSASSDWSCGLVCGFFGGFFGNNLGVFHWLPCILNSESPQLFCTDWFLGICFKSWENWYEPERTGKWKKWAKHWLFPIEHASAERVKWEISQRIGSRSSKTLPTSQSRRRCVKRQQRFLHLIWLKPTSADKGDPENTDSRVWGRGEQRHLV